MILPRRTPPRYSDAAPAALALVAVLAVVFFGNVASTSYEANIVDDSARRTDSRTLAIIEFDDGQTMRRGEIAVSAQEASRATLPLRTTITGDVVVDKGGIMLPPAWLTLLAAAAGATLGALINIGSSTRRSSPVHGTPPIRSESTTRHKRDSVRYRPTTR